MELNSPNNALYVYGDMNAGEASRFLLEHQINTARVLDENNRTIGYLHRSHMLQAIIEGLPNTTPVKQLMSSNLEIIEQFDGFYSNYTPACLSEALSESADHNTIYNMTISFFDLLQRKQREWGIVLNAIYKPIVAIDTEGIIVLFNKCMEDTFGIPASEAYGRKITDIITNSELTDVLTTGERQSLHKLEWQGKIYLSTRGPIVVDEQIIGAVAVVQEMSELDDVVDELEAVKKLNRQLDALFEYSYDGLGITDGNANTLRLNKAFERITGVSPEECLGQNMADLVREGIFTHSGSLLVAEKGHAVTITIESKTGKRVLLTSSPIYDKDGNMELIVTNMRDLTDLIELEEKLKNVQELRRVELDAIVSSSFDGLYITDGKAKTLRLNEGFERITGVNAEMCIGRTMEELVRDGVFSDSGTIHALAKRETVTVQLTAISGKSFLVTSTPVFSEQGEIVLVVSNVRNMLELEELERKLESAERLHEKELDAIVSSSFDGLYITDGKAKTLRLNEGFERITGVNAEMCIGRTMEELVRDGVFSDSGTIHALAKRETVTVQLTAISGKSFLVTSTPVFNEQGEIVLVVSNVRNMIELEELERKLESAERLHKKELGAIYDSSYDGLYITDGLGNTISLNKGFERIMGVTAAECVGRNMAVLVKEGVFSASGTLLALENGKTSTISLRSKTGKNALVTSTPIFDKDDIIVMVVTNVRDITELNELQDKVEHLESLSKAYQSQLNDLKASKTCVMRSDKMRNLMKLVSHISMVDSTVLIMGESGVGKEVVANLFHANGTRAEKPFIKVNCGAIPYNLLESELFGYEAGAFSGASKAGKPGLFEIADGGILFLDEIAEMPMDLQVKLLRVLQDSKIMRIGGTEEIEVNVRILAGTNRNLQQMVADNTFRKDLYYRLNVVPIIIPPLRERQEDIPVLAKHFLEMYNRKYNLSKRISVPVMKHFVSYDWPGNVRELENLIERLVVTTLHDIIIMDDIVSWSQLETKKPLTTDIMPLNIAVETTERNLLELAFSKYTSTYAVARALGVSQATIVRKANKYGIGKAANDK